MTEPTPISSLPSKTTLSSDDLLVVVSTDDDGRLTTYQTTLATILVGGSFATQTQVDTGATGIAVSPNTLRQRLIFPYSSLIDYVQGCYVESGFKLYKCILDAPAATAITNTTYFTPVSATDFASASQLVAGTANKAVPASLAYTGLIFKYSASVAYVADQYVDYSNAVYRVLTTTIAGDTPVSEPTKFQLVQKANTYASSADVVTGTDTVKTIAPAVIFDKVVLYYDSSVAYKVGQYVDYSSGLYRVLSVTTAGDTPVSTPSKFQMIGLSGSYANAADIVSGAVKIVTADLIYQSLVHVYNNSVTYTTGQIVNSSTKLYKAKGTTVGNTPPNTTYWDELGFVAVYATASEIRTGASGNKIVNSEQLYGWWSTVGGANVGSGAGIYKDKNLSGSTENFRFKSVISSDTRLTVTSNTNDVTFGLIGPAGASTTWVSIVSFVNGFVSAGSPYSVLQVRYEALDNTLRLRGVISNPSNQTTGTAVFSIPAPFNSLILHDQTFVHVQENAVPVIIGLKVFAGGNVTLVGPYTTPNSISVNITIQL